MTTIKKGLGKAYRKGISLVEAVHQFADDEKAEAWFVARRWPNGIRCPHCDDDAITNRKSNRKTPQYHCGGCKGNFTVKTGTIMHDSKLPLGKWALGFYLFATNLKGVSSMKLHRDLDITPKTAWFMAHWIRESWDEAEERFAGPVEVAETYIGGKESNKHEWKKQKDGRGTVGKTAVAGVKDRPTKIVESTDKATLQNFVIRHTGKDARVYTDEAAVYIRIPRPHEAVKHSAGEYVRDMAHTNGLESHWALFKRGLDGTYHHVSVKHLHRYTMESSGRHNVRPFDTAAIMSGLVRGGVGRRMTYQSLIGSPETRQPRMV